MFEKFGRKEAAPEQNSIDLINALLKSWKLDPNSVKDKSKNLWYLSQGSARFNIELFKFNKGQKIGEVDAIEVGGTIMKMPEDNYLPLYRRLLELNSTSVGTYFAIRGHFVMLLSTREVTGLDLVELKTIVDGVRFFSDYWDDILIKEFGGSK